MVEKTVKLAKKMWYWGLIIGLVILGVAIYSSFGKSDELKKLLKNRPKRKIKDPKLPKKPKVVDFVDLYKKKLSNLD